MKKIAAIVYIATLCLAGWTNCALAGGAAKGTKADGIAYAIGALAAAQAQLADAQKALNAATSLLGVVTIQLNSAQADYANVSTKLRIMNRLISQTGPVDPNYALNDLTSAVVEDWILQIGADQLMAQQQRSASMVQTLTAGVAQAKTAVANAQATVDNAQAAVNDAQAAMDQAQSAQSASTGP